MSIDAIFYLLLATIFAACGIAEMKTGRGIIRRNVTRENDTVFYWTEVSVSFLLAGIALYQAINEL